MGRVRSYRTFSPLLRQFTHTISRFTASGNARTVCGISSSPMNPLTLGFNGGPVWGRSGISLLHLSWGHPRRALPVILALWSPDFPHLQPFGLQPRLSDPVAPILYPKGIKMSNGSIRMNGNPVKQIQTELLCDGQSPFF